MKHSFKIFRLLCTTVAMIAIMPFAITTLVGMAVNNNELPPCAAGRIVNAGTLSLSNCSITGHATPDPGGGVANFGTLYLTNVVISGNTGASGGGIYNAPGATVTVTNSIISGNTAAGVGGGIHNNQGTVIMSVVTIIENTSGTGGGGLANTLGSMIGAGVAVVGNETLAGDGGGVLNYASLCLSSPAGYGGCFASPDGGGTLVSDNKAAGNGGGIANLGNLTLGQATVDRNRAESGNGGGLWNGEGTSSLWGTTFSNNTTTGDGGGIFNELGAVCCGTLQNYFGFNLTIAGNHANGNGGGVYTRGGYTGLGSTTIADNVADAGGGGLWNDDNAGAFTELKDTLLARNGQNCVGYIYSSGHNLDTGTTCGFSAPGDNSDVDDVHIGLGTLAANGGPMRGNAFVSEPLMTLALDPSSPAVNAGSDSCPATDERGVARPSGACDIGAFELEYSGPIVVTASITAAGKVYDATTAATITGCTLSGVLTVADVTCEASDAEFETPDAGIGKPLTATVTLTGADAGNYQLSSGSATTTAQITPAPASVTPDSLSKPYASPDPVLTGTLSGFLAADSVTATYIRAAGESVAGGPYTITASLSLAATTGNYFVTYNTANFTITKLNVSVTPHAASKAYGAADPAFTGTVAGFLAGDSATATYSRTSGESVGGGPYVISATLDPGVALDNYTVTYNTAPFTITKVNASITPHAASKTYGTADPALTGTVTGFLTGDSVTATYSRAAGESVAGGPYIISATVTPAGAMDNYTITYNTANFTINRAPASVTPNAAGKTYAAADPPLTGSLAGFLGADGVTAAYTRTAGETAAGGPYVISATLSPAGVLANYNVTYNTAAFTITGTRLLIGIRVDVEGQLLTGNGPVGLSLTSLLQDPTLTVNVFALYNDGSEENVTALSVLTTSNPLLVVNGPGVVNASGVLVQALTNPSHYINATYHGFTVIANLIISVPVLGQLPITSLVSNGTVANLSAGTKLPDIMAILSGPGVSGTVNLLIPSSTAGIQWNIRPKAIINCGLLALVCNTVNSAMQGLGNLATGIVTIVDGTVQSLSLGPLNAILAPVVNLLGGVLKVDINPIINGISAPAFLSRIPL